MTKKMIHEKEKEEVIDQKVVHIRVVTMVSAIIWIITTLICFWRFYNNINDRITEMNSQFEKRIIMLEINQQNKVNRDEFKVLETRLTNIEKVLYEIKAEQQTLRKEK